MENIKEGQPVMYEGKETFVETIHPDGTCVIANPNYDSEDDCEDQIPYWITVKISDLSF